MSAFDPYASPLTAEALIRNRGALIQLDDLGSSRSPAGETDPAPIERWDPWVRDTIALQELVSSLRIRRTGGNGGLVVEAFIARARGAPAPARLVTMYRPTGEIFNAQLAKVLAWAELREERAAEVLAQIDNQYAMWGALVPINTPRMPRTAALLDVAVQMAVFIHMRAKHELACWRPADLSPQVQPMICTPGHGSLPSGHATQAYVVAEVLKALLGTRASGRRGAGAIDTQFDRLAARIATNRVVAGVHFPVDSVAGRLLGHTLGEFFVSRCVEGQGWTARTFDGRRFPKTDDFDPVHQPLEGRTTPPFYASESGLTAGATADVLVQLWSRAREEITRLGLRFASR